MQDRQKHYFCSAATHGREQPRRLQNAKSKQMNTMISRVKEIDYLKCVFIILMVVFHLVYVGDRYPYAKQVVYTFHMPAFLLVSGYLANMDKSLGSMLAKLKWLFIPYAVMETGYIFSASVLPIREHIDNLTAALFAEKLLLHPLGPYWYLHTLMACYIIYYAVNRLRPRLGTVSFICVLGVCFYAAARLLHVIETGNAMYFLGGVIVRQAGVGFLQVFRPSLLAALPFALFCMASPGEMYKDTLTGVAMTYLAVSIALGIYDRLSEKAKRAACFIGSNTLAILLFSPMFTIVAKLFVPVFAFDGSASLYTLFSASFVLAGSLAVAYVMDRLGLSRWFSGKKLYNRP